MRAVYLRKRREALDVAPPRRECSPAVGESGAEVSILMTAYGVSGWLGRSILSAVRSAQASGDAWELLIGVDLSAPDLAAAHEAVMGLEPDESARVKIYEPESNVGSYCLLGALYGKARGRAIIVLDGDDELEANGVGVLLHELGANVGVDVSSPIMSQVDEHGRRLGTARHYRQGFSDGRRRFAEHLHCYPIHSGRIFTRRAFEALGGYRHGARHSADWDFILRAYAWGFECSVTEDTSLIRGVHEGQAQTHPEYGQHTRARARERERQALAWSMYASGHKPPSPREIWQTPLHETPPPKTFSDLKDEPPCYSESARERSAYWRRRYGSGGNSGSGSYGDEARMKARVIVGEVERLASDRARGGVTSMYDIGCGDGHQREEVLALAEGSWSGDPRASILYVGIDDALTRDSVVLWRRGEGEEAVEGVTYRAAAMSARAQAIFDELIKRGGRRGADVVLVLDVLFHLGDRGERDALVSHALECASGVAVFSEWHGDDVPPKGQLAGHCHHHGDVPWDALGGGRFSFDFIPIPGEPFKRLVVARRTKPLDEEDAK